MGATRSLPSFWEGMHSPPTTVAPDAAYKVTVLPTTVDQTPPQMRDAFAKGGRLLLLEDGWDRHGGKRPTADAYRYLMHILVNLFESRRALPVPQLVPLSYGGMQAEWHTWNGDLEIEVERGAQFRWYFRDRRTNEEEEDRGTEDFGPLKALADRL